MFYFYSKNEVIVKESNILQKNNHRAHKLMDNKFKEEDQIHKRNLINQKMQSLLRNKKFSRERGMDLLYLLKYLG